jgi:hypothetical protein
MLKPARDCVEAVDEPVVDEAVEHVLDTSLGAS